MSFSKNYRFLYQKISFGDFSKFLRDEMKQNAIKVYEKMIWKVLPCTDLKSFLSSDFSF